MNRTIVCGDLYGNYKAFKQCLERSEFDYESDTLIQLGDIVDGHTLVNETFECIEELLKIKNLILIKGNHDEWFKEFIRKGIHPTNWLQGGLATLSSYCNTLGKIYNITETGFSTNLKNTDIPESHKELLNRQVLYYVDSEKNIFVHGGFNKNFTLKENNAMYPEIFYWDRDLWEKSLFYSYKNYPLEIKETCKEIFLGHTDLNNYGIDVPYRAYNIWNLDTGAGWSGKLSFMDINTHKYWQSDKVNELYKF